MTNREFAEFVYDTMIYDEVKRLKAFLSFHGLDDEIDDECMNTFAEESVRNNIKEIVSFYEIGRKINR